jgi:hypothetical protein
MVYYEPYFDDARDVEIEEKIVTHIEPKMIEEHHEESTVTQDDLRQIEIDERSLAELPISIGMFWTALHFENEMLDDLEIDLFES